MNAQQFKFNYSPDMVYKRLFQLRKSRGESQNKFALLLGVSFRTYQRLETGESPIKIDHILKLATELDIPPAFFLHDLSEWNFSTDQAELELKPLFEYRTKEYFIRSLKQRFYNFYPERIGNDGLAKLCCSIEGNLERLDFSEEFKRCADINVNSLKIPKVYQNSLSVVRVWDDILKLRDYTKVHLMYSLVHIPEKEEMKCFSLLKVLSASYDNPRTLSQNLLIPSNVYVSNKDVELLAKELSKEVDYYINPISTIY